MLFHKKEKVSEFELSYEIYHKMYNRVDKSIDAFLSDISDYGAIFNDTFSFSREHQVLFLTVIEISIECISIRNCFDVKTASRFLDYCTHFATQTVVEMDKNSEEMDANEHEEVQKTVQEMVFSVANHFAHYFNDSDSDSEHQINAVYNAFADLCFKDPKPQGLLVCMRTMPELSENMGIWKRASDKYKIVK